WHVMLPPELLVLLRQWWKARPTRFDAGVPVGERWLFPGRRQGQHLTYRQLSRLFHESKAAAGITKRVSYIPFDIPSRQNCSRRGPTFVISKPFSDIPSRRRRHAIRALPRGGSRRSIVRSNSSAPSTAG